MAGYKKGQINQILFTLTDKTDFASIESGITKSMLSAAGTIKFYGQNHKASAFTSLTPSVAVSLITSGIFKQQLKATEAVYDLGWLKVKHASAADQNIFLSFADYDDSDLFSMISDLASKVLVISGVQSDIYSLLSSRVTKAVATASYLTAMSGVLSDVYSGIVALSGLTSDAHSAATAAASRALINQSRISDAQSYLVAMSDVLSNAYSAAAQGASRALLLQSSVSDVQSYLAAMSGVQSDIYSALNAGIVVNASTISDIASRVWSEKYHAHSTASGFGSLFSVLATNAAAGASRALLGQSSLSDIQSYLVAMSGAISAAESDTYSMLSNLDSKFNDRVTKTVANYSQVSDMWSDLLSTFTQDASDIASAVWSENYRRMSAASSFGSLFSVLATNAAAGSSRALLNQSRISDVYSMLSDFQSDFGSKVPKAVATASVLSDLASKVVVMSGILSDTYSMVTGISAVTSDVYSAVTGAGTAAIYSLLSDLESNFGSRVPKLVATDSALVSQASDLKSAIGAVSVTLTASDISDIISGILAGGVATASQASDILSMLTVMSGVQSDVYSLLSDYVSDFGSRVPKRVATDSQVSNLHSVTQAYLATMSGAQSDAYSLLSDLVSDFGSRVPKRVATDSQLSALASDIQSNLSNVHSDITSQMLDVLGTVQVVDAQTQSLMSRISDYHSDLRSYLVGMSATLSDVYSNLSDFKSDFQSRVPKAVATNSQIAAGVALTAAGLDAIWDEATSGHTTAGTYGELFAGVRQNTAAGGGSSTITLDASANSNDDFYNGCLVKIVAGTGAGQRRWITDYSGTTKIATVDTAWVTQPDATSKFVIL